MLSSSGQVQVIVVTVKGVKLHKPKKSGGPTSDVRT